MAWFRVDDGFNDHPKVLAIPQLHRPRTCGIWLLAGNWSAKHATDGFISPGALEDVGGKPADALRLVNAIARPGGRGLWELVDGGWVYHDWSDYQPMRAEIEARNRARAEAGKKGGAASGRTRRLRALGHG